MTRLTIEERNEVDRIRRAMKWSREIQFLCEMIFKLTAARWIDPIAIAPTVRIDFKDETK